MSRFAPSDSENQQRKQSGSENDQKSTGAFQSSGFRAGEPVFGNGINAALVGKAENSTRRGAERERERDFGNAR